MRRSMDAKLVGSLICAGVLGSAGCGGETIDAKVQYLQSSDSTGTQATGPETWLEISFEPDATVPAGGAYRLRMNGAWVLQDPSSAEYVTIQHGGTTFAKRAGSLATGPYTVELVDAGGKSVLTTSPLTFTPGRSNQIFVYGNRAGLHYHFFANPPAESDAVPEGSVLTRVLNLRFDDQPLDVKLCGTQAAPATDWAGCTLVQQGLAYGDVWTGVLPEGTLFGLPCVASELCLLLPAGGVGGRCPVSPLSPTYAAAKIETVGVLGINPNVTDSGFAMYLGWEYGDGCLPGP